MCLLEQEAQQKKLRNSFHFRMDGKYIWKLIVFLQIKKKEKRKDNNIFQIKHKEIGKPKTNARGHSTPNQPIFFPFLNHNY